MIGEVRGGRCWTVGSAVDPTNPLLRRTASVVRWIGSCWGGRTEAPRRSPRSLSTYLSLCVCVSRSLFPLSQHRAWGRSQEHIPEAVIQKIQHYIEREDFDPIAIRKASVACEALCMWTQAMYKYHFVYKAVRALGRGGGHSDARCVAPFARRCANVAVASGAVTSHGQVPNFSMHHVSHTRAHALHGVFKQRAAAAHWLQWSNMRWAVAGGPERLHILGKH